MKTIPAVLCLFLAAYCLTASGQGTAFTYQGRLNDGANPATGIYDLRFTIYGVSSGGSAVAGPLTNAATLVTNGIFTVTLDFGAGVFTGSDRWLEIDVRSNGISGFTTLSPRQALTATPYAVYAKGANAAGLTGALPPSILNGLYSNPLTLNNGANSFSGSFYGQFFGTSFTGGSFAGDGSGLINLNASQITEGTFPASSLGNAWRIVGNAGTSATNFLGTTDNQAIDIRVNNVRGLRIAPDPRPGNTSANIIGGNHSNRVELPGSGGNVIAGGGLDTGPNLIRSNSSGVFIGSGSVNEAGPNANDVVIAGGFANIVRTYGGTIGGGSYNLIQTNTDNAVISGGIGNLVETGSGYSAIAGGAENQVRTNSGFSAIAGGYQNQIHSFAGYSAIGGGLFNRIRDTADQSAIAGGNANEVFPGARESFIGGGFANQIRSNAFNSVIGGGTANVITNAGVATIGGGTGNTNNGFAATIAGGFFNTAIGNGATVGGGGLNVAAGFNASVGGGDANQSLAQNAFVGGGYHNTNSGFAATIAGGFENTALSPYATVPGGFQNRAAGGYSFAAGRQAKANHQGAFVWADSTAADFPSAVNNEFAVRASGGVRFVAPGMSLNGQPVLTATTSNAVTLTNTANTVVGTFNGDGAGLTNLNVWRLSGNAGTAPGVNFIGTTDNQALELKVNGERALRLEPTGSNSVNVVGGYAGNYVTPGRAGATIGGGGAGNYFGGSVSNLVTGDFGTISGGARNAARSVATTIGGGIDNRIDDVGAYSVIGGGLTNVVGTNAQYATISGGVNNFIQRLALDATISGGALNVIGDSAFDASIGGGLQNWIQNNAWYSRIGGGTSNTIALNANAATIVGGLYNVVASSYGSIGGGFSNTVAGLFGFAAGRQAKANHSGTFVWADSQNTDFASSGFNQFLVRAAGGVGINTNNPVGAALAVNGDIATSGSVLLSDPGDSITFPATSGTNVPMINMFASGTVNATRMVVAHSPAFPSYGLQYADNIDQFDFLGSGLSVMSIGLGSGNVGVGTNNPASKLHVVGGVLFTSGAGGANQSVSWSPGSASWSFTSDRNAKDRITPVDTKSVLEKLDRIPISEWSYIGHDQRHIGPMAQDFHAEFPLNSHDKALNDADLHGVALAAIQGLNQKVNEKDVQIQSLKTELEQLKKLVNKLANAEE